MPGRRQKQQQQAYCSEEHVEKFIGIAPPLPCLLVLIRQIVAAGCGVVDDCGSDVILVCIFISSESVLD